MSLQMSFYRCLMNTYLAPAYLLSAVPMFKYIREIFECSWRAPVSSSLLETIFRRPGYLLSSDWNSGPMKANDPLKSTYSPWLFALGINGWFIVSVSWHNAFLPFAGYNKSIDCCDG